MAYDYAKKHYKNASPANQKRFNAIVDDLRVDMSIDSAISEGLRTIREEIRNSSGGKKYNTGGGVHLDDDSTVPYKPKTKTGPIKGGKTPAIPIDDFMKFKKYEKKIIKSASKGGIILTKDNYYKDIL
jgi:hypothetical protein|tara:strand:- start:29 stop:412 length:384 start_codon:yes stop_codon:yes gene_type:complete